MDLYEIYQFLDEHRRTTKNPHLRRVLEEISQLLEPRIDVYDNSKLKSILLYLQRIQISDGKHEMALKKAFPDELISSPSRTPKKVESMYLPKKAFALDESNILTALYGYVKKSYVLLPEWRATYPADANGELKSEVVSAWQDGIIALIEFPEETKEEDLYNDFKRDIKIMGESGAEQSSAEIIKRLNDMVNQSYYPENIKSLLLEWIKHNGEQVINSLFMDLILKGEFNIDSGEPMTMSNTNGQSLNWLAENGKIFFDCKITVNALKYDNFIEKFLMATIEHGICDINDAEEFEKQKKILKKVHEKTGRYEPLIEFDTRIELVHVNGVIKPIVRKLDIECFTDKLHPSKEMIALKDHDNVEYKMKRPSQ